MNTEILPEGHNTNIDSDNGEILSEEELKKIAEEEDSDEEEIVITEGEEDDKEQEEHKEKSTGNNAVDRQSEQHGEEGEDSIENKEIVINEEHEQKTDILQELNQERKLKRKKAVIAYLTEYSKGPHRAHATVSDKLGINYKTGYDYLKEFVNVVKRSIDEGKYPDSVLEFYNDPSIEDDKRLKFYHIDRMKEVIMKYSNYDITKKLNTSGSDKLQSNKQVDDFSILDNLSPIKNQPSSNNSSDNIPIPNNNVTDIFQLSYGITPYQLLRFGLARSFGQTVQQQASDMIGPDPTEYFMSERKMKDMLLLFVKNSVDVDRFIEWLKSAAKYVAHPVGFLNGPMYQYQQQGGYSPHQQQLSYGANSSSGSSDMDDYYYLTKVYIKDLPPDHPANQKRLEKYLEREREEEEDRIQDRRFNKMFRMNMMKYMGGDGSQGGGLFGGSGVNSLFSPEVMLMTGNAEMKYTKDEQGNPTGWTIVPKFGGMGMSNNQQQQGVGGQPVDQISTIVQTLKTMMEMTASIQKQNSDPLQQNFTTQMMQIMMNRAFESPSNKLDELVQMTTLMDKIKGPSVNPMMAGNPNNPYANASAETLKELKQMDLDKEFVEMKMQFERDKMINDANARIAAEKEASANMDKMIGAIQGIAPTVMAYAQQLLQGNKAVQQQQQQSQQPQGNNTIINPQDAALKLHYEQQRRAEMERQRLAAIEAAQSQQQHPKPESQKVIIQERPVYIPVPPEQQQQGRPRIPTVEDFNPYSIHELEAERRKAKENIEEYERYYSTITSAINNKQLLGESTYSQPTTPPQQPKPKTHIVKEDQEEIVVEDVKDIEQIIDKAKQQYDPDYDAMTKDRTQQEEEVEDVELPDSSSSED